MDDQTAAFEKRYDNRAAVSDLTQHFDRWGRQSKTTRDELDCDLDVAHGDHPMEEVDTGASRIAPMIFSSPPPFGQCSSSRSKTRLSSRAQVSRIGR